MLYATEKARIELASPTLEAVATEELLSNAKTAAHYQVGKPDALGNPIVLGKPMTIRDYLAPKVCRVYVPAVRGISRVETGEVVGYQAYWKIDSDHAELEQAEARVAVIEADANSPTFQRVEDHAKSLAEGEAN